MRSLGAPFLLVAMAAVSPAPRPLPFIENDYSRALTEARATKRPIFVEAWAPW